MLTPAELLAQLAATRDADQKAREAKALGRAAVLVLISLALTACNTTTKTRPDLFDQHEVTLNDGTTVTCLTYDRALDCDWGGKS